MKKIAALILFFNAIASVCSAQVRKVEGVRIVVSDMERSVKFYNEVLGFEKISDFEADGQAWEQFFGIFGIHMRIVKMQLGDEAIELIDYLTAGGRSIPEQAKSNDLSFQHIAIVVSNMDSAYKILRRFNVVHVSTAPQTLPQSIPEAAGIKAFYFQDPDRHNLELIWFPKGKGQNKWQNDRNTIFLGIDHTAIGIRSTEKSHSFYHSILSLDRKGESWNKGTEQAHLNNVEGASLHITGYRSAAGIGVEFLQYLVPGPGKKYPEDSRSDDLWSWQTVIYVDNAEKIFGQLRSSGQYQIVSKNLVEFKDSSGTSKGFVVKDPDGHAVCILERRD